MALQELRIVAPLATIHSLYYIAGLLGWRHGYSFRLTPRGPFSRRLEEDLAAGRAPRPPRSVARRLRLLVSRLCSGSGDYCGQRIVVAALLAAYSRLYPPPRSPVDYYLQTHPGVDPSVVRRVASILASLGIIQEAGKES
ncbi:hypothetical protein CF15_02225 [Pyrodictium occultum]|uniref:Uncharacterized protein n=1 Tax=Pyrodictium occultum TaxID=2309 RepID=A0A0V8RUC5_PYROC|nr:hypothetical protein [Pyrodictium occultum]KSW11659.1 hypothetical protein CF15_02225 [Pyrodictium occultum]